MSQADQQEADTMAGDGHIRAQMATVEGPAQVVARALLKVLTRVEAIESGKAGPVRGADARNFDARLTTLKARMARLEGNTAPTLAVGVAAQVKALGDWRDQATAQLTVLEKVARGASNLANDLHEARMLGKLGTSDGGEWAERHAGLADGLLALEGQVRQLSGGLEMLQQPGLHPEDEGRLRALEDAADQSQDTVDLERVVSRLDRDLDGVNTERVALLEDRTRDHRVALDQEQRQVRGELLRIGKVNANAEKCARDARSQVGQVIPRLAAAEDAVANVATKLGVLQEQEPDKVNADLLNHLERLDRQVGTASSHASTASLSAQGCQRDIATLSARVGRLDRDQLDIAGEVGQLKELHGPRWKCDTDRALDELDRTLASHVTAKLTRIDSLEDQAKDSAAAWPELFARVGRLEMCTTEVNGKRIVELEERTVGLAEHMDHAQHARDALDLEVANSLTELEQRTEILREHLQRLDRADAPIPYTLPGAEARAAGVKSSINALHGALDELAELVSR